MTAGGGVPIYTEICAELGAAIAAASSTPGIQVHLILSLLGKYTRPLARLTEKIVHRIADPIINTGQVTFGHLLYARSATGASCDLAGDGCRRSVGTGFGN